MSSILKALEKVEQSQTGRRSGGPAGLARSGKRSARWVLPVGIIGGAAVAALVTFAAMGGFSRHPAPAAQQNMAGATVPAAVAAPPATPVTAAEVTGAPSALSKSAPSASASSVMKQGQTKTVTVSAPKRAKPASSEHANSASSAQGKSAARDQAKAAASAKTKSDHERHAKSGRETTAKRDSGRARHAESRAVAPLPAPVQATAFNVAPAAVAAEQPPAEKAPELRVTGIAWQKDSHSSAAIINGRPVQQGGVVDGYKVEQIFEDKVRLSGKGGHVEVPLGGGE